MNYSGWTQQMNETSPLPLPLAPTVAFVQWFGLTAHFNVTLPTMDESGAPLTTIAEIDVALAEAPGGAAFDPSTVTPVVFPGPYAPGIVVGVAVAVPKGQTEYGFHFRVGV